MKEDSVIPNIYQFLEPILDVPNFVFTRFRIITVKIERLYWTKKITFYNIIA